MYQLKHFQPSEFLPEGHDDLSVIDERLLETCDDVRDLLGTPCSINTRNFGGDREWCGFRTPDCTIGAAHSPHRLGEAADLHPVGMDANTARAKIREAVAAGQLPHLGGKVVEFHA